MFKKILLGVLLLATCYFPLFLHLDSLALFSFDEARLALNAWEMHESGHFLVTTFQGEPDLWNTKPPLMIWLQVLSMKLLGVNELAVRLPAALAALATILVIGAYCWRILQRPTLGLFAILTLLTTPGYIHKHVSRTGDYDALLILWLTLFLLSCFQLTQTSESRRYNRLLRFTALWLALAVLTKSVAGLLFLPAVGIYFVWKKEWPRLFKTPAFYQALALFLGLTLGYYGWREVVQPSYLEAVWNNEWGGRYLQVLEDHGAPFGYYFENIWKEHFLPWLFFLPLAIALAWRSSRLDRTFLQFLLLAISSFLLIISLSKSKLEWYDAPIYPLLALVVGLGLEIVYVKIKTEWSTNTFLGLLLFSCAIFGMPYRTIFSKVYLPSHTKPMNQYGDFIEQLPQHRSYALVKLDYNAQLIFYEKWYRGKDNYDLKQKFPDQLRLGETAMLCGPEVRDSVQDRFKYEVLESWKSCELVKIMAVQ